MGFPEGTILEIVIAFQNRLITIKNHEMFSDLRNLPEEINP